MLRFNESLPLYAYKRYDYKTECKSTNEFNV